MYDKKNPPAYLINPKAIKRSFWTPEVYQLIVGHRNPNYLHSVWLGTAWSVLSLPYRVFRELVVPLFHFDFGTFAESLWGLPVSLVYLLIQGLFGRVMSVNMSIEVSMKSLILTPEQGREALELGYCEPITLVDSVNTAASLDTVGAGQ